MLLWSCAPSCAHPLELNVAPATPTTSIRASATAAARGELEGARGGEEASPPGLCFAEQEAPPEGKEAEEIPQVKFPS